MCIYIYNALPSSDCFIVMDMIHSPGGTKHTKTPINNVDTAQSCCAGVQDSTKYGIFQPVPLVIQVAAGASDANGFASSDGFRET